MTPTFLPGPAPFRTRGEKTVKPPQSIEQASALVTPSGRGKTNRSSAIMPVEYPPKVLCDHNLYSVPLFTASLRDRDMETHNAIRMLVTVRVYPFRAVVLVVILAETAVITARNHRAHADAVADLNVFDLRPNSHCCSRNFVAVRVICFVFR